MFEFNKIHVLDMLRIRMSHFSGNVDYIICVEVKIQIMYSCIMYLINHIELKNIKLNCKSPLEAKQVRANQVLNSHDYSPM